MMKYSFNVSIWYYSHVEFFGSYYKILLMVNHNLFSLHVFLPIPNLPNVNSSFLISQRKKVLAYCPWKNCEKDEWTLQKLFMSVPAIACWNSSLYVSLVDSGSLPLFETSSIYTSIDSRIQNFCTPHLEEWTLYAKERRGPFLGSEMNLRVRKRQNLCCCVS